MTPLEQQRLTNALTRGTPPVIVHTKDNRHCIVDEPEQSTEGPGFIEKDTKRFIPFEQIEAVEI